ncbi:MAG: DUF4301 family protein [Flavobacteriales bacterium]|nr:DUF4301 family protein [Flavobacteriales bacterium]
MLDDKDLKQIDDLGINKSEIEKQLNNFENGFPYMKLVKPAIEGDGLTVLTLQRQDHYAKFYTDNKKSHSITKFVPASGAASRMFKDLFTFLNSFKAEDDYSSFIKSNKLSSVEDFFTNLYKFAFYDELIDTIKKNIPSYDSLSDNEKYLTILDYLLSEKGLNYGNKPKALLAFHYYQTKYRTAVSEHLVEGARYAMGDNRAVKIHFTISKEHREWFETLVNSKIKKYQGDFNVKYQISYSYQSTSTDTIAVTPENKPFRNDDGTILFRPGGHGALIDNLNNINDDIVFIKNIDNVVPDHLKESTIKYKRIIGGLLLNLNEVANSYQVRFVSGDYNEETVKAAENFLCKKLSIILPESYFSQDENAKVDDIKRLLNRPIRVCGMVKNQGEPGGGPFWTENKDGSVSLQIVEGAQIDMTDKEQADIVSKSTHFNPVDIVCTFKDWSGKSLNLNNFIDEETGFISEKSKDGKTLKALERPGLWNGAMSDWSTVFVEVPVITFNPVKTVNDLLRPEHQSLRDSNQE